MPDHGDLDPERTLATGPTAGRMARALRPGDVVGGNYKIKSVVGRGGMGVVYCAKHLAIDRDIALKALAPERVDDANWQRFQTEGKAIAKLDHPNIVKVYDLGTDGPDCLYYVMDLLHGVSLADYLNKNGVLDLSDILEIFGQLCSGLGYAHRQGLVHRDVKPSNIILCSGIGRPAPLVKIIDFGLVKLVGEANQIEQSQTATGQVFGSPLYMSPEQCLGGKIDARSDIYSLGCTLFECLTGKPPFHGKSGLETAAMHQSEEPPKLHDLRPDKNYPDNIEQLVGRMLEKYPAQRYQSMAQVMQDLLRLKEGKSVSRESIFTDGPLFEIDLGAEEHLQAPDRKTGLPLALLCVLGAVVCLSVAWATLSYLSAKNDSQNARRLLIGESKLPDLVTGRQETPAIAHAREVFADCPQISHGVVDTDGLQERVFVFPQVPLGFIRWGPDGRYRKLAQGKVIVPANDPVTLQLTRPESEYARMFPEVLAKIGPEDIYGLELIEPEDPVDDSTFMFELPVQLVRTVARWSALRRIDICSCKIPSEAVLALNDLPSIDQLNLTDSLIDGHNLAQVKWLPRVKLLILRATQNVDAVLLALANAPSLNYLGLDRTSPSKTGLQILTSCKRLQTLSLSEAEIDDEKLAVVCGISSLSYLSLKRCVFTGKALHHLARLKRLKNLNLDFVPLDQADIKRLRDQLPSCSISNKKIERLPINF
jgi:serine/threonine protein kinase